MVCRDFGIPVAMENPARSFLWVLPEVEELLEQSGVSRVVFDFSAFGAPWRKSTTLLFSDWEGVGCLARGCHARRCKDGSLSLCQYTLAPHQVLIGVDKAPESFNGAIVQGAVGQHFPEHYFRVGSVQMPWPGMFSLPRAKPCFPEEPQGWRQGTGACVWTHLMFCQILWPHG